MGTSVAGKSSLPTGAPVPSLVRWGLSSDADMMFRTIVTFGPRTERALAVELGLPLRRVDAALAELRSVGAAASSPGARRSAVWATRPPHEVIGSLRQRRWRPADPQARARNHGDVVSVLAAETDRPARALAVPGPAGGLLGDEVRYLRSRELTRERLAELMAVERHEHLAMNTEQAFDAASARAAAPLDRQIVERGVRIRVLGVPPADPDPHVGGGLWDHPLCGYREAPEVPMKLIIVDHRVALFPADPNDFERGYLEISQPGYVGALLKLYDRHWADAVDPREHGMQQMNLSDRERELINLLAQGHTDISAAEHMRISARSVTNIMRALMDRLGVTNRFQLGLALGAVRAAKPAVAIQPQSATPPSAVPAGAPPASSAPQPSSTALTPSQES